jgi:hypothetical protein
MNKLLLTGLSLLCFPLAGNAGLNAPSANDRLFQVDLAEFPTYRALCLGRLGPTPFNYARMMVQPAFAPEYSVSVYSRSNGRGHVRYVAAYVALDRNLWQTTDMGRHSKEVEVVKIRRIDCEIPARTADLIRGAWVRMLSGNQRPRPMREGDAGAATDATIAEFSIQLPHGQTLYGKSQLKCRLVKKQEL